MSTTTASSTGHLAMLHTVTAVDSSPIARPTASAAGPVRTSPTATTAASSTVTSVMRSMTGRSFQIGRPSSIS